MSRPGKVRALLATLRIANAPSVVSNVLLGCVLNGPWSVPFLPLLSACVAGLLLYFAGNLANDWFDRHWDASKRPERALPRGTFKPGTYLRFAVLLASAGVYLAFVMNLAAGITALVIVILIAIYTAYHKRAIWSVIPMGLCRAGLYFLGFFCLSNSPSPGDVVFLAIPASGLFCYIAGLSLSARYEGMGDAPQGPKVISLAMLIMPTLALSCISVPDHPAEAIAGMIPFVIWLRLCLTRFRKPIPRYVSALLAGIPLVDFIAMTPIVVGAMQLRHRPEVAWLIATPLLAFVAGRALQKLAPAT